MKKYQHYVYTVRCSKQGHLVSNLGIIFDWAALQDQEVGNLKKTATILLLKVDNSYAGMLFSLSIIGFLFEHTINIHVPPHF